MQVEDITIDGLMNQVHPQSVFALRDDEDSRRRLLHTVLDYAQRGIHEDGVPEMETAQGCAQTIFSMFPEGRDVDTEIAALPKSASVRVVLAAVEARIHALANVPV